MGKEFTTEEKRILRKRKLQICRCGKDKQAGHQFCRQCFFRLPEELRDRLHKLKIDTGYAKAVQESEAFLGELALCSFKRSEFTILINSLKAAIRPGRDLSAPQKREAEGMIDDLNRIMVNAFAGVSSE